MNDCTLMKLHPRQFVRLIDGRLTSPATIAFLPGHLGAQIACTASDVQITRDYARKIMETHSLRYKHFSLIQPIIDKGWCVKAKDNHLEFYHDDDRIFGRGILY